MDIDTADEIAKDQLGVRHVYQAHSQLGTSSRRTTETVSENINKFEMREMAYLSLLRC